MKQIPRISETEWEVMKVLWAKAPRTSGELVEELVRLDATWHPKTAKTLLGRLVKKKAVALVKDGRDFLYHPLVAEQDCVAAASQSFLERVFGGSLQPMLAHFVTQRKLSPKEITELRRLLQNKEEQ